MEVQTSDLKQVRKGSGLTQAQLAQLTGVSRQTIIALSLLKLLNPRRSSHEARLEKDRRREKVVEA